MLGDYRGATQKGWKRALVDSSRRKSPGQGKRRDALLLYSPTGTKGTSVGTAAAGNVTPPPGIHHRPYPEQIGEF